jgi:hypothetical protein
MNKEYIEKKFFSTFDFLLKRFDDHPMFEYDNSEKSENLEITMLNNRVNKRISFYLLSGVNFQDIEYYDLDIRVENISEDKNMFKWSWFLLKDYCKYLKLEQVNHYYKYGQTEEEKTEVFFDFVKDTMLNHGLLDLLLSRDWQVIPIDMSPYK